MDDFVLRELRANDEPTLRQAVKEFVETEPDFQFAFGFHGETDFDEYLARLRREKNGESLAANRVPGTYFVAVAAGRIIGRVSLRHELNDYLRNFGGHIGFGVVPAFRRRGYGTEMLRRALPHARAIGLDRVLVTCDDDNLGSIRIIETCGGILDDTRREGERWTRRYWIDVPR